MQNYSNSCQIYRVTEEALIAETVVWPIPFLTYMFTAPKGSQFCFYYSLRDISKKKVQVGKDQEKAQSEKDSHSKNRGGKKTN